MKQAVVVKADDWEGLFIDGKCIEQGHTLNQGTERLVYFIETSIYYNFDLKEVAFKYCTDEYYNGYIFDNESFPDDLSAVELEE